MLHIVRHGRTAHNASGRLLGRLDIGLDEVGLGQAESLARAIGTVDLVVSSPLQRTRSTAEAIAAVAEVPVVLDERWIELDYGELDGVALREVPADVWSAWRRDPTFAPPGGESLESLGNRVRPACDELLDIAEDREVVVVTHVSPIKAAVCWALGVDDAVAWRTFVAPASITRVGAGPAGPVLHSFNGVEHLRAAEQRSL